MRFTQCSIPYGHRNDFHGNRRHLSGRNLSEYIEIKLGKGHRFGVCNRPTVFRVKPEALV